MNQLKQKPYQIISKSSEEHRDIEYDDKDAVERSTNRFQPPRKHLENEINISNINCESTLDRIKNKREFNSKKCVKSQ